MSSPEGGKRFSSDFPKQKNGCSVASASVYDKDTGGDPPHLQKALKTPAPFGQVSSFCRSSDSHVQRKLLSGRPSPSQVAPVTRFRGKRTPSMLTAQQENPLPCSGFAPDSLVQRTRMRVPLFVERGRAYATKAGAV